jgi:nitrogenase subunit NifH
MIPYSEKIKECSGKGVTLFQLYPDSAECNAFSALTAAVWNNQSFAVPRGVDFEELHSWWKAALKEGLNTA